VDRSADLLRQPPDELCAEAGGAWASSAETGSVVADDDQRRLPVALGRDFESAGAAVRKAMLDGVGEHLVEHEAKGRGVRRGHLDALDMGLDRDFRATARTNDIRDQVLRESADIEMLDVFRLIEPPMHRRQGVDPLEHGFEPARDRRIADRTGLEAEE